MKSLAHRLVSCKQESKDVVEVNVFNSSSVTIQQVDLSKCRVVKLIEKE